MKGLGEMEARKQRTRRLRESWKEAALLEVIGGYTAEEISKEIGKSEQWVYQIHTDPRFIAERNRLRERKNGHTIEKQAAVRLTLQKSMDRAAQRLMEIMEQNENLNAARLASKDLLDFAGMRPTEKIQVENSTPTLMLVDGEDEEEYEDEDDAEAEEEREETLLHFPSSQVSG